MGSAAKAFTTREDPPSLPLWSWLLAAGIHPEMLRAFPDGSFWIPFRPNSDNPEHVMEASVGQPDKPSPAMAGAVGNEHQLSDSGIKACALFFFATDAWKKKPVQK
jgi:hypothetical protein